MKSLRFAFFASVTLLCSCAADHGRRTFRTLDFDRDGKVSVAEFASHLSGESFRVLDHDANGVVSAAEWTQKESVSTSNALFRTLDHDGNGSLDQKEFAAPQGSDRYAEIESVFHTLDRSHDGVLEWDEIVN